MTIIESEPYIIGERFLGNCTKNIYRADENTAEKAIKLFSKSQTAEINLKATDSAKDFYDNEPDLREMAPPAERDEYFYCMKTKIVSPIIPAKDIFLLQRCYALYGTLNYFPRVCPKAEFNLIISKGYISDGYSLRDVACTLVDSNYTPLSIARPKVKHGDFWDVYIPSEDAVAILPEDIADKLSNSDIEAITVQGGALTIGKKQLRFLGAHAGAVNSIYDYRHII